MDHPLGTVTRHHDPSLHFNFQEKSTCGWYDALHNTAYVWFCILYCFTDVNQDDSPKSLRLNLRTPKCFNCNLQRTTSHWSYCNGWLGSTHPTQDVSLQVLGSLNPNLNLSCGLNPINDLDWHPREYLFIWGISRGICWWVAWSSQWCPLPLFNEFCELRRAPWRWEWRNGQGLGDMTLASSKLEEDLMFFCLFSPGIFEHWTFYLFCHNTKDIW